MATLTFPKLIFHQIKASLADRVRTQVKNAGPQIGDSAGDFEDQAWTLVEENVAFNWSISGYLFFRQGDSICLLVWFAILTCLIALKDGHLIVLLT